MFDTPNFEDVAPETAAELDTLDYTIDHFDNYNQFVDICRDESEVSISNPELSREIGEALIEDGFAVVAVSEQGGEQDIVRIWFEELTVETVEKTVTEERIAIDK